MEGLVHSLETLGTVDGPGIRFVVFLQGCPLRCLYCHNPDTWKRGVGQKMTSHDLLEEYNKNSHYYHNGGITVTGGEALLQIEFLIELFTLFKQHNIHTCLDTSGVTFNASHQPTLQKFDQLLAVTDLVLLDVKHIDDQKHRVLVGASNESILNFARYLSKKRVKVWIRHVVIPTLTDNPQDWYRLGYFLGELTNIQALDVLPYHTMGTIKYEQMGMKYKLKDINDAPQSLADQASKVIMKGIYDKRVSMKQPLKKVS